jgi:antitoxin (DNA-binding transcriptional repressor) of toxin-antitoxin stability system
MSTVTLEQAKKQLDELVQKLPAEGEIVITSAGKPVATLRPTSPLSRGEGRHSALDIKPSSVGGFLKPIPHPDDDILGEMLDNKFDPSK